MKKVVLRWVLLAVSVFGASVLCQALNLGFQANVNGLAQVLKLMVGVALLAFLNATLGSFLKLITLPLSCLTLGLFSLAINASILYYAATFNLGFSISQPGLQGFIAAFVASLMISIINGALGIFLPDDQE